MVTSNKEIGNCTIMSVFLIVPLLAIGGTLSLLIFGNLRNTFTHDGNIGGTMGATLAVVFTLLAAFSFFDNQVTKQERSSLFFSLWLKWILSCTTFGLFITVSSWYLCAAPEVQKEGMVFTHPQVLGAVYNYVSKEPLTKLTYTDESFQLFEDRVLLISAGLFQLAEEPTTSQNTAQLHEKSQFSQLRAIITGIPFYIAFGFSMIGAVIYALMDSLERLNKDGLLPKDFLSYLLRCTMAPFIATVVCFYLAGSWPAHAAPAIGFFIGFFPKKGLALISSVAENTLAGRQPKEPENTKPA